MAVDTEAETAAVAVAVAAAEATAAVTVAAIRATVRTGEEKWQEISMQNIKPLKLSKHKATCGVIPKFSFQEHPRSPTSPATANTYPSK